MENAKTIAPPETVSDAEFLSEFLGDVVGTPPVDSLEKISALVEQVRASEGLIGIWECRIAAEKAALKILLEVAIPEAMLAVGMRDIGLADGSRVKIESFHYGSITAKTKVKAHQWLEEHGFGGLITRKVNVEFGKDSEGYAGLAAYIKSFNLRCTEKEGVHPQTLGAFIRNQVEKGEPVPQDLFNIYSGTVAALVKPKPPVPL